MGEKKDKVYNIIYLLVLSGLVFFIPLSQNVVVYLIALLLAVWLSEKPWYLILVGTYVALVWHTQSALYIALGIIVIVVLTEVLLVLSAKQKLSLFDIIRKDIRRAYILGFAGFYMLYMAGLLYSTNLDYADFDLEVKFSMLIFPMIMSTLRIEVLKPSNIKNLFVAFVIGCLISTIICLTDAFIQYSGNMLIKEFYYIRLSYYHHPGYFAMFLNFAIAVLICFMMKDKRFVHNPGYLVGFISLILYFSVFVVILSSKAGILSLLVLFMLTIGYLIVIKKRVFHGIVLVFLIAGMLYLTLSIFTFSLERIVGYQQTIEKSTQITDGIKEETGDRFTIWSNALEIIKGNIVFGVGTGDVKDVLLESYKNSESQEALEKQLNAHNQYLQTFITLGIFGFLVLILSLILPGYYSIKKESFIYMIFLAIIAVNFLIESMLETQAGVVFYAFFNVFLLLLVMQKERYNTMPV